MNDTVNVSVNLNELAFATDSIRAIIREIEVAKACCDGKMESLFNEWQNRLRSVLDTISIDTSGVD